MPVSFAPSTSDARPLYILEAEDLADWLAGQAELVASWVTGIGFKAASGEICVLPDASGHCEGAILGLGNASARSRTRLVAGQAVAKLPAGTWRLAGDLSPERKSEAALAWLLGSYRFTRYNKGDGAPLPQLVAPEGIDAERIASIARGEFTTRDLINTPASDMGPDELEAAVRTMADTFGAVVDVTTGDDLLAKNFPMIHAVGRASTRAPRLIDMRWGSDGPTLTLVGKGVCFDTGGLNLKPGASMGLMKKDMGGAATTIGLARTIMELNLPLRLRLLVPAVENSVSGSSFRPQDILSSRAGLTVEINNTDAEGRLVLADALTYACEDAPDLLVSMATLTGAARVAVGPDLAPFYCDSDATAAALHAASARVADPVWRMPFHAPYEPMIEPGIADLDNAPKGGFAGSITAALFLRRFVQDAPYTHFDIYGWQPTSAPARPKGGVGQGARALLEALPALLDLPG